MNSIPWILVTGVLVLLLAVGVLVATRGKRRPVDYYSLFMIGIIWMPVGIATENQAFFILGLVFMGVGLANKDKWKENRVTWDKLSDEEKKIRRIVIAALTISVILGLAVLLLIKTGIL